MSSFYDDREIGLWIYQQNRRRKKMISVRNRPQGDVLPSGSSGGGSTPSFNQPTNLIAVATNSTAIDVSFEASIGDVLPTGFLILGKKSSGSFPSVVNGTPIADLATISSGYVAKNLSYLPTNLNWEFTSLDTDTIYNFIVYAYRGSGASIVYNTTSPPTTNCTLQAIDNLLLATSPEFWVRGDALTDKTGNHTATPTNTPTVTASILNGRSVIRQVNADRDRLDLAGTVTPLQEFTCLFFFKADITSGNYRLIDGYSHSGGYATTGFGLNLQSNNIRIQLRRTAGIGSEIIDIPFSDTSSWHVVQIKMQQEGSAFRFIVKLDGSRVYDEIKAESIDNPTFPFKIGDGAFTDNLCFDGDYAEAFLYDRPITRQEEALWYNYINTYYGTSFTLDNTDVIFSGLNFVESLGIRTNGLDYFDPGDGKMDLFFCDLDGKIYYSQQGATIDSAWTTTEIMDMSEELSSLMAYDIDGDGVIELLTLSKVASTSSLRVHKPDSTNYATATWTTTQIKTGLSYCQDILRAYVDTNYNLVDEQDATKAVFFYTHQGASSGNGGINWIEYNGGGVNNASNWTDHSILIHESAWWLAGFYDMSGAGGDAFDLVFSARNTRNSSPLPGIYYVSVNASGDIRDAWARTTIDNTVADWLHLSVGNFFGNEVDIAASRFATSTIYMYDSSSAWAQSTVTGSGSATYNLAKISAQAENGRDSLFQCVESDFTYRVYWTGSAWYKEKLWAVGIHPFDNEFYTVNLDSISPFEYLFDDSTTGGGNVTWFRLLRNW